MKIFELINSVSSIRRWSQAHCARPESVLEHTAFVAMYSYHLCCKHDMSPGAALVQSIVHDIEEVATGDIPKTTKYHNETITAEIKRIEEISAKTISDDVFNGKAYIPWKYAKDLSTDAGCVVAIADSAACLYKLWQEVSLGNKSFLDYKLNIEGSFEHLYYAVNPKFCDDVTDLINFLGEIE